MPNQYLRSFVIGSSFPVFFPFFFAVSRFDPRLINYRFAEYVFIAPVALGIMNMVSLFIANKFKVSRRDSLFITSIIAPICVLLFVKLTNMYNYKTLTEWVNHSWKLILMYLFAWNVIVYSLEKLV